MIFKKIVKLAKSNSGNAEVFSALMILCKDIITTGVPPESFSNFLSLLNTSFANREVSERIYSHILPYLANCRKVDCHANVFVFTGTPSSGIGLLALKSLPRGGYCFCASVRVERPAQGTDASRKMTIFKLCSSEDRDIELYVEAGYLHYTVLLVVRGIDGNEEGEKYAGQLYGNGDRSRCVVLS